MSNEGTSGSRVTPCTRPPFTIVVAPKTATTRFIKSRCGHLVWEHEQLVLDGKVIAERPDARFGNVRWAFRAIAQFSKCNTCEGGPMLKMTIVCGLCGRPIFPGNPVCMLRLLGDPTSEFSGYATHPNDDPNAIVSCMAWDCCPSGGFFAGHWTGEGVQSPYSTGTAAGDVLTAQSS